MFGRAKEIYEGTLSEIREAGLYKDERIIVTPAGAPRSASARSGADVLNFCANNYLGLSSHPEGDRGRAHARSTRTASV